VFGQAVFRFQWHPVETGQTTTAAQHVTYRAIAGRRTKAPAAERHDRAPACSAGASAVARYYFDIRDGAFNADKEAKNFQA
jgi:hypothetical protein